MIFQVNNLTVPMPRLKKRTAALSPTRFRDSVETRPRLWVHTAETHQETSPTQVVESCFLLCHCFWHSARNLALVTVSGHSARSTTEGLVDLAPSCLLHVNSVVWICELSAFKLHTVFPNNMKMELLFEGARCHWKPWSFVPGLPSGL